MVSCDIVAVSASCCWTPTAEHNIEMTNAMPTRQLLTGRTFGKRKVIADLVPIDGVGRCLCICECGSQDIVDSGGLLAGRSGMCRKCSDSVKIRRVIHGHTKGKTQSPTFVSWHAMISRCKSKKGKNYKNYGSRGITVCQEWH